MDFQAFFFDFDGVLADSVEVKTRAFAKIFESFGQKIQAKVVDHHRKHGGMNRFDKFRHYYTEFLGLQLSEEKLQELCKNFAKLVVDEVVRSPEIPGAEGFLKKCFSIAPCFLVSATPENEICEIVKRRNLAGYFKEVLGAPSNKTDNLKKLLSRNAYNPAQCFFLGDAESDFIAAENCRVNFIGIVEGVQAPLLQKRPHIQWFPNFTGLHPRNLIEVQP